MGSLPAVELFRPLDPEEFIRESRSVVNFIAGYYRDIEKFPVRSPAEPGDLLRKHLPEVPPQGPEAISAILDEVRRDILPGLTHWQSPNFFAYFQANASTAGFVGEMLCSGFNVVGFNWVSSPAATELETIVVDWMGKILSLPPAFLPSAGHGGGGVLHGSTCEAMVCTLAAARDRAIREGGSRHELIAKLVVYASDQTHFSLRKAAKIVGIPPENFREIATSAETGYALTGVSVRSAIEGDVSGGMIPLYLCATVGTTAVGAVDPIPELAAVAREHGVWLHVDAAYAGSAAVCPEFRQHLDSVELAESMSMNPHKWFLTNMDCCCLWLRDPSSMVESLSTKPEILRNKASESMVVIDYKDWQIALSRRFRAIKLWVVMKRYGAERLAEHIRSDVEMARRFEGMVRVDERFEVVVPARFALVCFRMKKPAPAIDGADVDVMNQRLLEMVNSSGRLFMTHAVVSGVFLLRFAVGATLTEMRHVEAAWKVIQEFAAQILLSLAL